MPALPRLVIAAVASNSGKTTLALGLIAALRRRGLRVQPFKVGPDYIDPGYHTWAAGRPSRNLDRWLCSESAVGELFVRAAAQADISVIEGVMGLFDGHHAGDDAASTADIARLLQAPVVLVVDVAGTFRSAAAVVLGCRALDPRLNVAGVVLNYVGSETHYRWTKEAIESATGVPVLGYLPRRDELALPSRHLGLVPVAEDGLKDATFQAIAAQVEETVAVDALLEMARSAPPLEEGRSALFPTIPFPPLVRIAVAQDEAFSFYYQDNLDLLRAWGAEPVPFSPLHDAALPEHIQGIYLGGGFPELYGERLSANERLLAELRHAHSQGMPIYAECGGLMYLSQGITDLDGQRHAMAGLLPVWTVMQRQRPYLAYLTLRTQRDTLLAPAGATIRAHEFHYSQLEGPVPEAEAAYAVQEHPGRLEGFARENLLASYAHLHFGSDLSLLKSLIAHCVRWAGHELPSAQ